MESVTQKAQGAIWSTTWSLGYCLSISFPLQSSSLLTIQAESEIIQEVAQINYKVCSEIQTDFKIGPLLFLSHSSTPVLLAVIEENLQKSK